MDVDFIVENKYLTINFRIQKQCICFIPVRSFVKVEASFFTICYSHPIHNQISIMTTNQQKKCTYPNDSILTTMVVHKYFVCNTLSGTIHVNQQI